MFILHWLLTFYGWCVVAYISFSVVYWIVDVFILRLGVSKK